MLHEYNFMKFQHEAKENRASRDSVLAAQRAWISAIEKSNAARGWN
jgi:hypothetical protein